ncbi:DUF1648 domain-containing protein [Neobacillus massiliamazoniensis]|uniref:DUF1648 domain-containing protein n=1 Tax=Neobacillus massiliamazoniensis TaxID=1499688 RepID=A0A0U1NWH8_9BACI|nr:DUF5808 domain-containing protein [Neobacillus massiliamazoniensis]CRK82365.1 hypothetical protein BN000_02289 [Neobacillus massiliamazoniensis]
MEQTMFLIIFIFLVAIETAIPFLVKRTVVFGVSIPDRNVRDEKLVFYKKIYSLLVFVFSVIIIGSYLLWTANSRLSEERHAIISLVIQFCLIFLSTALYFYFHAKTLQRKRSQKWGENLKEVKITDLAVRSQDEMLPWYVFLIPMVVTMGFIGYTFLNYNSMPARIPMHWGPDGKPNSFTEKNPFSVNALLYILLTIQVMFLGMNVATKRSGIKLSATRINASRIRQLSLRKYSSWFLFMISVLITLLFSFLQLTTIHAGLMNNVVIWLVPVIFTLIVLIGSIVFAVKVGNAGEKFDLDPVMGITDTDEDQYWMGGMFYFNKNDPSIFVEKRFGIGWTINFAHPIGLLILLVPIVVILLIAFFS